MKTIFLVTVALLAVTGLAGSASAESELVVMETSLGKVVIEFFPDDAPNHVENFITLTESGFYDGVLFHRIIPGFMIQGGDPNTIAGDPGTWGTGGPAGSVDAEFNSIKHVRGIVSMARSADPNSGGSQFFIVHQDSNFLDGQYTVFGRIVTQDSFETLDRIAAVETDLGDAPLEPENVRITSAVTVDRSEIPDLLDLGEPERMIPQALVPAIDNQKYESAEHGVVMEVPAGWLLQTPEQTQPDSPDVVAVGPQTGLINPVISLKVEEIGQSSPDDLISEKLEELQVAADQGILTITSKLERTVNGYEAYEINTDEYFETNGVTIDVKFREVVIFGSEKSYTLVYANGIDGFDAELPSFEETVDKFAILSDEPTPAQPWNEAGGCLIATATFGSELAPQVQQLRELRDGTIMQTSSGAAFMAGFNQIYYSFSPTIADLQREHPAFRETVKLTITPMLAALSVMEHAESESQVLGYGVGVILMNIGMYLAAPAAVVYVLARLRSG